MKTLGICMYDTYWKKFFYIDLYLQRRQKYLAIELCHGILLEFYFLRNIGGFLQKICNERVSIQKLTSSTYYSILIKI